MAKAWQSAVDEGPLSIGLRIELTNEPDWASTSGKVSLL